MARLINLESNGAGLEPGDNAGVHYWMSCSVCYVITIDYFCMGCHFASNSPIPMTASICMVKATIVALSPDITNPATFRGYTLY
jgi:hypothetical protein